jgi:hypothetical protein
MLAYEKIPENINSPSVRDKFKAKTQGKLYTVAARMIKLTKHC